MNFQMFKLDLEKAGESEINYKTIWSSKKQENSRKTSTSALLTTPKPLTVGIITNCGKFLKRWEYQPPWPASWEICMQVKKQQLEWDTEQQSSSKSGTEYVKAVCCHPVYLILCRVHHAKGLDEAKAGIKIAGRIINNLRYTNDTTLMAES